MMARKRHVQMVGQSGEDVAHISLAATFILKSDFLLDCYVSVCTAGEVYLLII